MLTSTSHFEVRRILLGVLLAVCSHLSIAAEWMSGQITAINPETNSIEIDGRALTLTAAAKYDRTNPIDKLKPGLVVRYEADGKFVKRIEVIQLPPS
jgi:hypothetical protein